MGEVAESLSPFDKIKKERNTALAFSFILVPLGLFLAVGGFAMLADGGSGIAVFLGLIGVMVLGIWGFMASHAFSDARWDEATRRERAVQDSWICLRCGHTLAP